ncbi:tetratricopeptide repeat domain 1 [Willisornis vidua]|uniref:Tetratricopeptide repeat domain 1 n=1 Tax=Willisornis vidua TaxID=1566151 RepID=A0ABQ9CR06_9PASS|nr:tetratricopeptide repeat domain 1 [Willisornis vidua]
MSSGMTLLEQEVGPDDSVVPSRLTQPESSMEKFKDPTTPEESLSHLKLSDQKSAETDPRAAQNPQSTGTGCPPCSGQDPPAEECFHDCHDSFEAEEPVLDDEGNVQNGGSSSRKQTELDEEYLLELEKDMPEEEKQVTNISVAFLAGLNHHIALQIFVCFEQFFPLFSTNQSFSIELAFPGVELLWDFLSNRRRKESTMLKEKGNEQFKKGDYGEAEDSYTKALQICPACFQKDRAVLFSNRAAAKMKQDKTEAALSDCTKAVELDPHYIRALLRRAELYEKTEKLDEALEDYKAVLERDPSVHQAREACMRLPRQIEERNEKLKKEMLGKLKDLGNLVLRPFGLSTENFQIKQDSSTGSYSINFVQNPNNNR